MRKKYANTLRNIAGILLLLISTAFFLTLFLKNKNITSTNTTIDNSEIVKEVEIPTDEIEISRKSQTCKIEDGTKLPSNWPNDIPLPDNIVETASSCLTGNVNAFEVEIHTTQSYSYLTFALVQDFKQYGWTFQSKMPGLNPPEDGVFLTAIKEERRITLTIEERTVEEGNLTFIRITEEY